MKTALLLWSACLLAAAAEPPAPVPAIRFERAWPALRFHRPVFLTPAPGDPGRLFAVEQDGRILSFPAAAAGEATPFLDLTDRTLRYHEESGLLGLAFHPRYAENGLLYVCFSDRRSWKGGPGHTALLARFRADPKTVRADAASEEVLLRIDQPFPNHNGGCVLFGPDGMLYLGLGDGGSAADPGNRAQDPREILGKMLRIDVDRPGPEGDRPYGIPAGNPFKGKPEAGREEIFAMGLRNPWRFSFDRKTGELWAGDVGQNAVEEIDVITAGGNYGWNWMEGSRPFRKGARPPGLTPPVAEYPQSEGGKSVTGGYVYRGKRFPALEGVYLYADYVSGKAWGLRRPGKPVLASEEGRSISSFAEDAEGELYAVSLDGKIWRICPAP